MGVGAGGIAHQQLAVRRASITRMPLRGWLADAGFAEAAVARQVTRAAAKCRTVSIIGQPSPFSTRRHHASSSLIYSSMRFDFLLAATIDLRHDTSQAEGGARVAARPGRASS